MFLLFLLNRDNLFRGPDNANLWFTLLTSLQSQASAKQRPNLLYKHWSGHCRIPLSKWWFCGTPLKSMLVKSDHLPESKIHIKTCFVTYESMNDEWWLFVTWSKSLWVQQQVRTPVHFFLCLFLLVILDPRSIWVCVFSVLLFLRETQQLPQQR